MKEAREEGRREEGREEGRRMEGSRGRKGRRKG